MNKWKTQIKLLVLLFLVFTSFNLMQMATAMPDDGGGGGGGNIYTYTVKGYIRDTQNNAISGASVAITSSAVSGSATTGSTGYFQKTLIRYSSGALTFTVAASKAGYFSLESSVYVSTNGNSQINFNLHTSYSLTIKVTQVYMVNDATEAKIIKPNGQYTIVGPLNGCSAICPVLTDIADVVYQTSITASSARTFDFTMSDSDGTSFWGGYIEIETGGSSVQGWSLIQNGIGLNDLGFARIHTLFTDSLGWTSGGCTPTTCLPTSGVSWVSLQFQIILN